MATFTTIDAGPPFKNTGEEVLECDLTRGAAVAVNGRQVASALEIREGLRKLRKINGTNQGTPQQAGFRAEVHHETTFSTSSR